MYDLNSYSVKLHIASKGPGVGGGRGGGLFDELYMQTLLDYAMTMNNIKDIFQCEGICVLLKTKIFCNKGFYTISMTSAR